MTDTTALLAAPSFLDSGRGVSIAYHSTAGKSPGVMFCGGFMSDMTGTKALRLEAFCRSRGHAFTRFDYAGHGQSQGKFEDGTIGDWTADALAVLDRATKGPVVLVGSSMGGWIALNLALARPDRVAALVGIAAAPDFTEDLMWHDFPPEAQMILETEGVIYEPSDYSDKPYPITMNLIHEARAHLLLRGDIAIDMPVRLLHGMLDPDVPWKRSLMLAEKLRAQDVRVTLIKDGDHRLSREQDLELLTRTVDDLVAEVAR
jgi:pimeloyl-ACP methyl ester carboxylesterase